MGGLSIDGLVTGLDTANIIKQLLDVERAPVRRLESKKTDIQRSIAAYRDLNTRFTAVRDAADKLSGTLDWQDRTAESSDDFVVSAAVTGTPAPGSMSFAVTALATTHTLVTGTSYAADTTDIAGGQDLTVNGTVIPASAYGSGTIAEIAAAINSSGADVTASTVQVSPGQFRLQLTSATAGAAGTFTADGTPFGGFGVVTAGADATITIGTGPGAYSVSSATNTFSEVLPGLDFTARALGSATITVSNDAEGIADKVAAMVQAMNEAVSYISARTKYDAETKTKGIFLGSSLPSGLRNDLTNSLIDSVAGSSLVGKSVGIETDRNGVISFDRDVFLQAYAADPAAVEGFFSANGTDTADDGIAERVSLMAEAATRLSTGRIATAISSREANIETINDRIEGWDVRLELRETALRRQFANLETTLGRLQQQGQWLGGQLAGMLS